MVSKGRPARPTVLPHPYVRQDGVPADPWTGLAPCRDCHKVGRAGDAQHPTATDAAAADRAEQARQVQARMLGERER